MADFDDEKQKRELDEIHKTEEEELVATLAESKYRLPYINLYRTVFDNEALRSIPEDEAREMKVAPFKLSGKNILIAVRTPSEDILAKLKDAMERRNLIPVFHMASLASLQKVWERYQELSMAESSQVGGLDISVETLRKRSEERRVGKECRSRWSPY